MTGTATKKFGSDTANVRKTFGYSKITKSKNRLSNSFNGKKVSKTATGSTKRFKSTLPQPSAISQSKLQIRKPQEKQIVQVEDIEFKKDPDALESILNDQGITTELLQQNALKEGRPSMVSNNTYLFPDGRPSLCRRVPIQRTKPVDVKTRNSLTGPKRVLSKAKAPKPSLTGQRYSFLVPSASVSSRQSLYSVAQGRYNNTNSAITSGRMSLPNAKNKADERKIARNTTMKSKDPVQKTPPPVRVARDIGFSASPALRVKQPTVITPLAKRSVRKAGQQRVKFADEDSTGLKDNLAVHLFPEDSPFVTSNKKQINTTPTSILKGSKHNKCSSSSSQGLKKETSRNDDDTVEIITPQVLNEPKLMKQSEENSTENQRLNNINAIRSNSSSVKATKNGTNLLFSGKKTEEISPRILQTTSPVLNNLSKSAIKVEKQETFQPKAELVSDSKEFVEVDHVIELFNRHMMKIKRQSVKGELTNVMRDLKASLKEFRLHSDVFEEEDVNELSDANGKFCINPKSSSINGVKTPAETCTPPPSPKQQISNIGSCMFTPSTVKDIREHGNEQTRKDFDKLTKETDRIKEELSKLQKHKEQLESFQQKIKLATKQESCEVPELIKSEKLPNFSKLSFCRSVDVEHETPALPITIKSDDIPRTSWEKVLKSEMNIKTAGKSPASKTANDIKSHSLNGSAVTPSETSSTFRSLQVKSHKYDGLDEAKVHSNYTLRLLKTSPISIISKDAKFRSLDYTADNSKMISQLPIVSSPSIKFDLGSQAAVEPVSTSRSPMISCSSIASNVKSHSLDATKVSPIYKLDSKKQAIKYSSSYSGVFCRENTSTTNCISRKEVRNSINSNSHLQNPRSYELMQANQIIAAPLSEKTVTNMINLPQPTDYVSPVLLSRNQSSQLDSSPSLSAKESPKKFPCTVINKIESNQDENDPFLSPLSFETSLGKENLFPCQSSKAVFPLKNFSFSPLQPKSRSSHQHSDGKQSSPLTSQVSRPCLPATPKIFAPNPIFPLPFQTPAAFRALQLKNNLNRPVNGSPLRQFAAKQQFAQALLDEEVSLLTCRVVKPSTLLQPHPTIDPVAHSLAHGDDTHFVPISKTPSATPRRHRRSSFSDSAFSKYLRM